ncbi:MAG: PRC-barrel domain containing protein [Candidatus Zixiibacteriota bacterium]|nr:MAG: PRC-barrel domain containing protein [candidate division Zixibacteria bacterium]
MYHSLKNVFGYNLLAEGDEFGKIKDAYFDPQDWSVRYFVVDTGLILPGRKVLIPPSQLGTIDPDRKVIPTTLSVGEIKSSPALEEDRPITREYETDLYSYYGWEPYWFPEGGMGGFPTSTVVETPNVARDRMAEPASAVEESYAGPGLELLSVREVSDYKLHAVDGNLGEADDFLFDDRDWKIRYLIADTGSWLLGRKIPINLKWVRGFDQIEGEVHVDLSKKSIEDSPEWNEQMAFDYQYESDLETHYVRSRI